MKRALMLSAVLLSLTLGCARTEPDLKNQAAERAEQAIQLPAPQLQGGLSVAEAIYNRLSRRSFSGESLTLAQAGQLLWSAGGLGADGISGASRTAPSAGATYPLDIYLLAGDVEDLGPGLYRYNHREHALAKLSGNDKRTELARAALNQEMIKLAPACIVLVARYERTTRRYGDRGVRYVHLDAGHAAQNIHLQAEALGLATVVVGAFDDGKVNQALALEGTPLVIMPIGPRF